MRKKGIELYRIDVSKIRNWKPEKTQSHYREICAIINKFVETK